MKETRRTVLGQDECTENVTLRLSQNVRMRQNGRHFADNIFKCIFLNENFWIQIKNSLKFVPKGPINNIPGLFLACSRACASKVFSLQADCGRVIVYPGLKQWERPRHNIFGVCTRLAGGVCMSTSANSSASKHLTVTKIVWKIVYVTFDYLISHFFKILSLEFMANLFRDFRASVSLKVFHYRLRGKWCQYDLEIN